MWLPRDDEWASLYLNCLWRDGSPKMNHVSDYVSKVLNATQLRDAIEMCVFWLIYPADVSANTLRWVTFISTEWNKISFNLRVAELFKENESGQICQQFCIQMIFSYHNAVRSESFVPSQTLSTVYCSLSFCMQLKVSQRKTFKKENF